MRIAMEPTKVSKPSVSKPKPKAAPKPSVSRARSTYTARVAAKPVTPRTVARPLTPARKPVAPAKPKPAVKPTPGRIPAPTDKITPKPGTPAIPTVDQWLAGDTTYQDQIAQLQRAYAEMVAGQKLDETNYQTSYAQQLRDLNQSKEQGFSNLQDDYASRGLLKSGLYADAYSQLQDQFNNQQTGLDTARAQYEAGLNQSLTGFTNDQNTTKTSAMQEAIARRAAKFNLGA